MTPTSPSSLSRMAAGIYGAWLLARREPKGVEWFDDSVRGFWHSFLAAALLLPAVLALGILDGTIGGLRSLSVEVIAYVIQWTAYPVIAASITESMGRGHRWVRLVVAGNWASVIQMAAFLPVAILALMVPGGGGVAMVGLMVTVLLLVYQVYVTHAALEVPFLPAATLVLLNVLLSGLISSVAARIAG